MTDPSEAHRLVAAWPLPDRTEVRDRLLAAYRTGRGYHDDRHLAEVLARLDELARAGATVSTELLLAAWFHDAVYDGAPDDEERSARLAEADLAGTGVDVTEVARLVRLTTTHDPAPDDTVGAALCDADLAILAADPARYREYAAGVRRDYAAVPDADFRAGRLAVLEELRSRPALFRTEHARRTWEPRARENLAAEIAALG
ncbi:HD domain-containing protein [Marmoricola sp. RAF53]|uniref:HD domain-containing protein n=1 Tax=Marmoricola sp. RAF53 TaxID=3233059 RepID=UPI003F9AB395